MTANLKLVKKGPGRKRKWANDNERKRASKTKKKLEAAGVEVGGKVYPESVLSGRQTQFNKDQNPPLVPISDGHSPKKDEFFYLVGLQGTEDGSGKEYWIYGRSKFGGDPHIASYPTLQAAKTALKKLEHGQPEPTYFRINSYFGQAEKFLLAYRQLEEGEISSKDELPAPIGRLGFYLAMYEKWQEGFEGYKGSSAGDEDYIYQQRKTRRLVYRALGNVEIPNSTSAASIFKGLTRRLIEHNAGNAESYIWSQVSVLLGVGQLFLDFEQAFENCLGVHPVILRHARKTIKKGLEDNLIEESENYDPLKLTEPDRPLKKLLDFAWNTNTELYHYTLLALSTGLRPADVAKLASKKDLYLTSNGRLNYKCEGLKEEDWLNNKVLKGSRKKAEKLENPILSLVARVIIKHFDPALMPSRVYHSKSEMRKVKGLEDCVEYSLRATCATHLGYCNTANVGRSDLGIAQIRLAHSSRDQLDRTYAKKYPDTADPEDYFKCPTTINLNFGGEKVNVAEGNSLWDIFLLHDFMERHTSGKKKTDPDYINWFKKAVYDEAMIFQGKSKALRKHKSSVDY